MDNYRFTVLRLLQRAGYQIKDNAKDDDVLKALSDYEEKFDNMKEHLLMQKTG